MNAPFSPALAVLTGGVPAKPASQLVTELRAFLQQSHDLDAQCVAAHLAGDEQAEAKLADQWSAVDDRIYIHRTAIRAAADEMLEREFGVTLDALVGLL